METRFDVTFAARVALREKQIQQNFRPVIGVHKWFARRPGSLFRCLLLAEFGDGDEPAEATYFRAHRLGGTIADPFMGGGTPLVEANRLGFHVIGSDINPMAWWIVRQELGSLDDGAFAREARSVAVDVEAQIGRLYRTECESCGADAEAKYFVWVKTQVCPSCGTQNDLTPGHLLAEATRHPRHVLSCSDCARLVELDHQPTADNPAECPHCGGRVVDIIEPMKEALAFYGLSWERDLEPLGREGLGSFVLGMPSRRTEVHLHRQIIKNPNLKPKNNDLEDWSGLGPATVHCDVVVCEKHFANLLRRDGFQPNARVITDLRELPDVLMGRT